MQLYYLYWRVSKGNCSNPLFIVTEHPPSLLFNIKPKISNSRRHSPPPDGSMLDNLKSASIGSARVISEMEKALNFRGIAGGFQNDQFYNVNL